MQEINKAKISMSLVGRQQGEGDQPPPTQPEEEWLHELTGSHQTGARDAWVPFLESSPDLEFHRLIVPGVCDCEQVPPGKQDYATFVTTPLGGSQEVVHVGGLPQWEGDSSSCQTLVGRRGWRSHSLEVVGELQIFVEQVAEVGDRKGVHPVVVGGIPVALLHHQTEPGRRRESSRGASDSPPPGSPSGSALPPFLSVTHGPRGWELPHSDTPGHSQSSSETPSQSAGAMDMIVEDRVGQSPGLPARGGDSWGAHRARVGQSIL